MQAQCTDLQLLDAALEADGFACQSDPAGTHVVWEKIHEPFRIYAWYATGTNTVDMRVMFPSGPDGIFGQYMLFGLRRQEFIDRLTELRRHVLQIARTLYYPVQDQ